MKLMVPLISMFILIGLTQTRLTGWMYVRMLAVILVVLLYFFLTWPFEA